MERGQLDTRIQQRFIWIWEGCCAHLPVERRAIQMKEKMARRTHQWDTAVELWKIHEPVVAQWWTLLSTSPVRSDIAVTTREPAFAKAVAGMIERENLPVRYVFAVEAHVLGHKLTYMPDVVNVFYSLPNQQFVFGPKGYHVPWGGENFQPLR
jgi:hypothetical protein